MTSDLLKVNHVLAATGYRVDLAGLDFKDDAMRRRVRCVAGSPRLSGAVESSVPGVYFTGLASAATFGRSCDSSAARVSPRGGSATRSRAGSALLTEGSVAGWVVMLFWTGHRPVLGVQIGVGPRPWACLWSPWWRARSRGQWFRRGPDLRRLRLR
jgi:hypothetical protein